MASGDGAAMLAWFDRKVNALRQNLQEAGKDLSDDISDTTKEFIASRPSAKSGKAGRIDTGKMYDSVSAEQVSGSRDEWTFRAGYHNGPKWTPYQEAGFDHNWSGEHIAGTYALHDAEDLAKAELPRRIKRAVMDT